VRRGKLYLKGSEAVGGIAKVKGQRQGLLNGIER
jgi:hypothetical protein